jgi:hypothetical protein
VIPVTGRLGHNAAMRTMTAWLLLSATTLLGWSLPCFADAESDCAFAVMRLRAEGLAANEQHIPTILTSSLATEIGRLRPGCRILTQDEITQMMDFEAQRALCGNDSDSCLVELGNALGVGNVVGGTVGRLGDTFTLQARLIDNRSASVLRRTEAVVEGGARDLQAAAQQAARELLGASAPVGPPADDTVAAGGATKPGPPLLAVAGGGLLAVGVLSAAVGGFAVFGTDSVLEDPRSSRSEKDSAIEEMPVYIGLTVAALVVTGVGAGLLAWSFVE